MPELKCTVQTCMHNKDFYCDLNAITVGGKSARKAAETSCDSFEERKKKDRLPTCLLNKKLLLSSLAKLSYKFLLILVLEKSFFCLCV